MIYEYFSNPDSTFYWSNGSFDDIENFADEESARKWIIDCNGNSLRDYCKYMLGWDW